MELNTIREMWELVSKTAVNPEVEKLLRATQLFEFVKNQANAYTYINILLGSINGEELRKETIVMSDNGKEVTLFDLFSSLKTAVESEILQIKK